MPATPKRQGREPRGNTRFLSGVLADNLRAARARMRLSQDDLAERMQALGHEKWSRATVSQVEGGGRNLTVDELLAAAMALHVLPLELLDPQDHDIDHGGPMPLKASVVRDWLLGVVSVRLDADGDKWRFTEDLRSASPGAVIASLQQFADKHTKGDQS